MTLAYGWITKTQKRISDALVGERLTRWEMQFIQTIDIKLEAYKADSRINENQHRKLFTILTKAESSKAPALHPAQPYRSPFELAQADVSFKYDSQHSSDPEDIDGREDHG
jgi:hypothetical protein